MSTDDAARAILTLIFLNSSGVLSLACGGHHGLPQQVTGGRQADRARRWSVGSAKDNREIEVALDIH